jgi:4-hydroxy-2-oxoheptanedioate aldolase
LHRAGDAFDAVLIGRVDLSSDLGVPGELGHPTVVAAVDEIIRVAQRAGKPFGMGASSAGQAEMAIGCGARYVLTSANACLTAGAAMLFEALEVTE